MVKDPRHIILVRCFIKSGPNTQQTSTKSSRALHKIPIGPKALGTSTPTAETINEMGHAPKKG
ncbi:hypothetical protein L873DRAFT_1818000 [Choiromyces venosus 120613-1]|uniref:Uncharacterized protein n=1 Tax=Choiromyces venosus 120613-1 TaxID=1336337 RepID=A0A3N4IQ72_9PEZI|nr:hypothetical protein L873DRAFT_1824648 [Choiromyces venosus 120613-1]RPA88333.1 hypothetical protein L873DRAFT_1824639 [Choiromyces venosus 120613-1]RPA92226.1 hypothetical protein L873DRAFT_1818000 [Choiromyces venosus 120613-1]